MFLGFLPSSVIQDTFAKLQIFVEGQLSQSVIDFFDYFLSQWLCNSNFIIDDWCQHRIEFRTNNVCEHFHSTFRRFFF